MLLVALTLVAVALALVYRRPTDLFHLALRLHLRALGFRARRVQLPLARIRYWDGGAGAPVVFVHGFGTEAAVNWHAQLRAVRRHHRVVAPDLPGFGGSERLPATNSIALQVATLRDLLDRLGLERVTLVGHSMGGWISLAFAAAHPGRVARLVLVDAAGLRFEPDPTLERLLLPETIDDVHGLIAANFQVPPRLPRFVLRDVRRVCRRELLPRTELLRRLAYGNEFLDDKLADIAAPTLIVWGRADVLTPVALGERLAAAIPNARLVVYDDCAHSPNVEQPARVNALLLAFLAGHTPASTGPASALAATG